MSGAGTGSTCLQFRIAATASLLWNVLGCLDYILIQIRDPGYIKSFPPELMPWIDGFPYWATAVWGLGVGASLAGSILLLLRSRRASLVFLASFAFSTAGMGYRHFSGDMPASLNTVGRRLFDLFLLATIALQFWYARRAALR
jgi:hypothetical protein